MRAAGALLIAFVAGCAPPPAADPQFDDAAAFLFREFEAEEPARLAFAMRALEQEVVSSLDLTAESALDRATTPGALTLDDLVDIDERPEGDPANTLSIAVARQSLFAPEEHVQIQLLADHTSVEPNSPNKYDRTFLDGTEDCWPDHGCDFLRTRNDLIRENLVLEIPHEMVKNLRWVDVALPDPSSVPEGEPVVNPGEPSWGILARSWVPAAATGESGQNTLHMQYSFEVWIPRDGGALRMMSLWFSITGTGLTDELQIGTARAGIEDIFELADEFIAQ